MGNNTKDNRYQILKDHLISEGFKITDTGVQDYINGGTLLNSSWCAGKDIFIGLYNNEDLKIASLAHEAGHYLSSWRYLHSHFDFQHPDVKLEHSTIIVEAQAWEKGFCLLKDLNIEYDKEVVMNYVNECLVSYCGYKG